MKKAVKNPELGKRFKLARENAGLSQDEVAINVGISQPAYAGIELGYTETPKNIKKYEKIFGNGVTAQWLQFGTGFNPFTDRQIPEGHVPIIPWNMVKDWTEGNRDKAIEENFGTAWAISGSMDAYALKIEGDAMVSATGQEISFRPNQIVIAEPEKKPTPNSYVVVIPKGSTEAVLRQYIKDGGDFYLSPLNNKYPSKLKNNEDLICGVVIGLIDTFGKL